MIPSIIALCGSPASSCGYCSPPGTRSKERTMHSFFFYCLLVDPEAYQALIDAGWRRSGELIYKPNNATTCCPQHTIRLPVDRFTPSRSQRRALKSLFWEIHRPADGSRPMKKRGNDNEPFDLQSFWHAMEWQGDDIASTSPQATTTNSWYHFPKTRKLEVRFYLRARCWVMLTLRASQISLRPASASTEKFELFRRYQTAVHKESPTKNTMQSWQRFLVHNSFTTRNLVAAQDWVDLNSPEPIPYGCYHHEWRLDRQLIAVAVLDILPSCVSAVYFYYDPDYEHLNLGKASAMREILLVQQLQRKTGMDKLQFYYLGFYIANCQKMEYKAAYRPQMVLDTATGEWQSLQNVQPALDAGIHYNFSRYDPSLHPALPRPEQKAGEASRAGDDDGSDDDDEDDEPLSLELTGRLPPGFRDPESITQAEIDQMHLFDRSSAEVLPLVNWPGGPRPEKVAAAKIAMSALGELADMFALL
ncbi:Arginyl-tRNA--protein transferase 1 [Tilletia horrida]|nr:Arginyl-tRNA--protein transferase 1 [Tilletia horrida]